MVGVSGSSVSTGILRLLIKTGIWPGPRGGKEVLSIVQTGIRLLLYVLAKMPYDTKGYTKSHAWVSSSQIAPGKSVYYPQSPDERIPSWPQALRPLPVHLIRAALLQPGFAPSNIVKAAWPQIGTIGFFPPPLGPAITVTCGGGFNVKANVFLMFLSF